MPNVEKFAKALFALHQAGCLSDPKCRPAIGMFVRQATESAHWHLTTNFRSLKAAREIAKASKHFSTAGHYHDWCKKNLRHEHMVPTSVVIDMLLKEPVLTEAIIAETLRRTGLRATIHRTEDDELNRRGFKKKMPDEFWDPSSELHKDPLARYKVAELFPKLVKRERESWFP